MSKRFSERTSNISSVRRILYPDFQYGLTGRSIILNLSENILDMYGEHATRAYHLHG